MIARPHRLLLLTLLALPLAGCFSYAERPAQPTTVVVPSAPPPQSGTVVVPPANP